MRNAKQEIQTLGKGEILCADIDYIPSFSFEEHPLKKQIILKQNYTPEDLIKFFEELDFEYDNGYGGQELFGYIWFKDGSWAEREEYDGSEWWIIPHKPEIPAICTT